MFYWNRVRSPYIVLDRALPSIINILIFSLIEPGSPAPLMPNSKSGSGKTRAAFYLRTTPLMRASRRVCTNIKLKHHARKPGKAIDMKAVKADAAAKMSGYR